MAWFKLVNVTLAVLLLWLIALCAFGCQHSTVTIYAPVYQVGANQYDKRTAVTATDAKTQEGRLQAALTLPGAQ